MLPTYFKSHCIKAVQQPLIGSEVTLVGSSVLQAQQEMQNFIIKHLNLKRLVMSDRSKRKMTKSLFCTAFISALSFKSKFTWLLVHARGLKVSELYTQTILNVVMF